MQDPKIVKDMLQIKGSLHADFVEVMEKRGFEYSEIENIIKVVYAKWQTHIMYIKF